METICYELYVIQTDTLYEQAIDKIVMNEQDVERFLEAFQQYNEIQLTGLFGCSTEVQKNLFSTFGINSFSLNAIDNGKIIGIQQQQKAILCLLFEEDFFLKKPINEKSVQITLARIFCDLTHHIQLSFLIKSTLIGMMENEMNVLKRLEYFIDRSQNREIVEQRLSLILDKDFGKNWLIFPQLMTPYFLKGNLKILSVSEQKDELDKNIQEIAFKFLCCLEKNEKPNFQLIYDCSTFLKDYDNTFNKKSLVNLYFQIQELFSFNTNKNNKEQIQGRVKQLAKQLFYEIEPHIEKRQKFDFQRCICRVQKKLDQSIGQINLETEQIMHTLNFNFGVEHLINLGIVKLFEKSTIEIQAIFRTRENSDLFIFHDSSKKQSYLYVLPKNQTQWMQIGTIQQLNLAVYFFNQKNNQLFVFNSLNNKQINKFEVSDKKLINQQIFCQQIYEKQGIIIEQVAYLSFTKNFLFLLKESKYKNSLFTLNEDEKKMRDIKFQQLFQNDDFKFYSLQLHSCPSGKYFYISNLKLCNMFDCNFKIIRTIQINGRLSVISDGVDIFLICLSDKLKNSNTHINTVVLSNVIELSSLRKVSELNEEIEGNPAFDLFKGSQVKFGPLNTFLSKNDNLKIQLYLNDSTHILMLQKYMKLLNLEEYEIQVNETPRFQSENLNCFKGICYSRMPIQLCTIDNGNITPLIDGFRKEILLYQKIEVSEKAELLRLGFLEKYLNSRNEKIFVVSIIGKQSSGKSYLLNRIFGTRYSVAACRCTDGVWASLAKIEDQNFLILDCEGLFSSIRSQKEEVQLLALLTALSDITLLNQDLTFNRYLNELLENLTAASDQLVGDTLFKGILNIVLRDISAQDNSGVDEELIANINLLKSGDNQEVTFLRKLFNSRFYVEKLFNFENKKFDDQIVSFRNRILRLSSQSNRWLSGEQLISSLKILLCQLEMSDKTNSSLLQQQQKINQFFKSLKKIWIEFIFSLSSIDDSQELQENQNESQFFNDPADTRMKLFQNQEIRNSLSQSIWLKMNFSLKFQMFSKNHNDDLVNVNKELKKQLEEKKEELLLSSDAQFTLPNRQQEIIDFFYSKRLQFNNYLLKQINSFTFCLEKCQYCFLKCTKFQIHDSESKHQLEMISRQIFSITEKQKEFDTLEDDVLSQVQEEYHKNQLLITNYQRSLKQYDMLNECEQLKAKINILKGEIELHLPVVKQRQCFQSIKIYLIENEDEWNYDHKLQNQTENIQCLKQIKQVIIKKFVQIDNEIKNQEAQIKNQQLSKSNLNRQIEQQFKKVNSLRQTQQCQEAEIEMRMNELKQQKLQLYQKQQQEQYENINKIFPNINAISNSEKIKFLSIQFKKNQEQLIEIKKEIDTNNQELTNWIEDTAPFQTENLTYNEFLDIYQKYQNIQQDIEQKIIQQKALLEKQTKNYRLSSLNQKLQNQFKIEKKQIEQSIKQLEEEQMKHKYIQVEQINEIIANNFGYSQEQIFEEYRKIKQQERQEITFLFDSIRKRQEKLEKIQLEINFYQEYLQLENQIENLKHVLDQADQKMNILNEQYQVSEACQLDQMNQLHTIETQICQLKNKKEESIQQSKIIDNSIQELQKIIDLYPQYLNMLNNQQLLIENIERIENELQVFENNSFKDAHEAEKIEKEIENISISNSKLEQKIQSHNQFELLKSKLSKLLAEKNNVLMNKEEHSCQRHEHICDEMCCICSGEFCKLLAGHNGEHLCHKQEHLCGQICSISDCSERCSLQRNHVEVHQCQKIHLCNNNCQYCTKQCQIRITIKHEFHTCGEIKCNQKCFLCESYCKENHDHSLFKKNYHFCQKQEHSCNKKCQKSGICKIVYQQVESEWVSTLSSFKYINYVQLDAGKQNCILSIQYEQLFHEDQHTCFQDTDLQFHVCGEECQECQAFCTKKYGHTGQHSTHQHRNKEKQRFTLQVGILEEINIDETKKYQVGDSAQPETCSESCKRRGRSHFHLVECKGGEFCLEKQLQLQCNARHSKVKYQNFEEIEFDEILCNQYWEFLNWIHPINQPRIQEEISKCNYYCGICDEKEKIFCCEEAWHTESAEFKDHNFSCTSKHKFFKGLSICFVIDSTLSMDPYLKLSVQAIKQIMVKALLIPTLSEKIPIEFSVVTYKDHDDPIVVSHQDFSSDQVCINFLDQIIANGGGDEPEAMLDG